jgi:serine/threonine-protein kinase
MADRLDKGTTLEDRFRIEELIGGGGMGAVYAAYDLDQRHKVAVKVLNSRLARNTEFRERFVAESRMAAQIPHPHILPVLAHGEDAGRHFLAMRLVETDLGAMIARDGAMDPTRALNIIDQIGWALDTAHAEGLVHRDVKPENVLVTPRRGADEPDQAYLCDFGIAKLESADPGWTRTGAFIGTMSYASPEQTQSQALDGRSDQYSLACVLFEALTGGPPFGVRGVAEEVMAAHREGARPRPSSARPELPAALDAVLARGMAVERDERFESCRAMVANARRVVREAMPQAEPEPTRPAPTAATFVGAAPAPGPPPPSIDPPRGAPPSGRPPPSPDPTARAPSPPPAQPQGRSRRPLALAAGGLAALVVAGVLVGLLLGGGEGGGASTDDVEIEGEAEEAVVETVRAFAEAEGEEAVCATLSSELADGCVEEYATAQPIDYTITGVTVSDDLAEVDAVVSDLEDPVAFTLVEERAGWRINEIESSPLKTAEERQIAEVVHRFGSQEGTCEELFTRRFVQEADPESNCENVFAVEPLRYDITDLSFFSGDDTGSVTAEFSADESDSISVVKELGQWRIDSVD